jgi:hypothetical protein
MKKVTYRSMAGYTCLFAGIVAACIYFYVHVIRQYHVISHIELLYPIVGGIVLLILLIAHWVNAIAEKTMKSSTEANMNVNEAIKRIERNVKVTEFVLLVSFIVFTVIFLLFFIIEETSGGVYRYIVWGIILLWGIIDLRRTVVRFRIEFCKENGKK